MKWKTGYAWQRAMTKQQICACVCVCVYTCVCSVIQRWWFIPEIAHILKNTVQEWNEGCQVKIYKTKTQEITFKNEKKKKNPKHLMTMSFFTQLGHLGSWGEMMLKMQILKGANNQNCAGTVWGGESSGSQLFAVTTPSGHLHVLLSEVPWPLLFQQVLNDLDRKMLLRLREAFIKSGVLGWILPHIPSFCQE